MSEPTPLYYKLDGHKAVPCSLDELCANLSRVIHVAKDVVGESAVSTVFLGVNHQFHGGPPKIFETLVFGGPRADTMRRYSTWEEAERGHAEIVAELKKANE